MTGPGLGLVTFADEDLSGLDDTWYCQQGDLVVETARALKAIEQELYKLGARFTGLIP